MYVICISIYLYLYLYLHQAKLKRQVVPRLQNFGQWITEQNAGDKGLNKTVQFHWRPWTDESFNIEIESNYPLYRS